ncbi:Myb-like protein L [Hondaea fermentalgiana]|uniref:Myb-like protein L n=1 Tax=Hondaea fermentalgiana TaxID=2315210 RepID=A0A2R5GHE3_9STRA|nr:Myb-like protein L [Hondaea fermentalgiana]|eukprot:GBG27294.1 Myb-like protein L [Hondaea fermentalgiana]
MASTAVGTAREKLREARDELAEALGVLEAHVRERWGAARDLADDGVEDDAEDEDDLDENEDVEEDDDDDEDDDTFTLRDIFDKGTVSNQDAMQWRLQPLESSGYVPWTPAATRRLLEVAHEFDGDWERVQRTHFPGYSTQCLEIKHANETCRAEHGSFTKAQDKALREVAARHKFRRWDLICKELNDSLGTNFTEWICLEQFTRKGPAASFTESDDRELYRLVQVFGDNDWQLIAELKQNFTARQCAARYREHLEARGDSLLLENAQSRVRLPWTDADDDQLRRLAVAYDENWTLVSKHLSGRSAMQCRERFKNVLDSALNKAPWSASEDELLRTLLAKHGHGKWSKIANEFNRVIKSGKRTPTMCRKRASALSASQSSS